MRKSKTYNKDADGTLIFHFFISLIPILNLLLTSYYLLLFLYYILFEYNSVKKDDEEEI